MWKEKKARIKSFNLETMSGWKRYLNVLLQHQQKQYHYYKRKAVFQIKGQETSTVYKNVSDW